MRDIVTNDDNDSNNNNDERYHKSDKKTRSKQIISKEICNQEVRFTYFSIV